MRYILIITLLTSHFGFSQGWFDYDENYLDKKNSISFNIGGLTPVIGVTYERYLGETFMIEIGGGYDKPSFEGGIGYKFMTRKATGSTKHINRKFKMHIGLRHSFHLFDDGEKIISHSIVVGAALFSKSNLNFSFDLGPSYLHTIPEVKNYLNFGANPPLMYVNFNLKVGYRFGKSKKEFEAKH